MLQNLVTVGLYKTAYCMNCCAYRMNCTAGLQEMAMQQFMQSFLQLIPCCIAGCNNQEYVCV